MNPESVDVTAGLGGFLAFFLLALALYFLMRNMNARLQRMAYREELEARGGDSGSGPDEPTSAGLEGGPEEGHTSADQTAADPTHSPGTKDQDQDGQPRGPEPDA